MYHVTWFSPWKRQHNMKIGLSEPSEHDMSVYISWYIMIYNVICHYEDCIFVEIYHILVKGLIQPLWCTVGLLTWPRFQALDGGAPALKPLCCLWPEKVIGPPVIVVASVQNLVPYRCCFENGRKVWLRLTTLIGCSFTERKYFLGTF